LEKTMKKMVGMVTLLPLILWLETLSVALYIMDKPEMRRRQISRQRFFWNY
jgi:hypothetical protein